MKKNKKNICLILWVTPDVNVVLSQDAEKKIFFLLIIGLPFTYKCINW